jgi:NADH:ubiquinone oxidoreductase subunit 3 (subunit A)
MNKKGQTTLGISIIVAITLFIVGMVAVNYLQPEVTRARSVTGLDCTNSSISDGAKVTCLAVDIVVPYFMVLIISVAGGLITARFLI